MSSKPPNKVMLRSSFLWVTKDGNVFSNAYGMFCYIELPPPPKKNDYTHLKTYTNAPQNY